jgi:hypothetical protein
VTRRIRLCAAAAGLLLVLAATTGMQGASAKVLGKSRHVNQVGINWAGYVANTANATSVHGQWTVPDAGLLPPGVASTWVGIGGYGTSDLIQAGTIQDSTPLAGIVDAGSYAAWYELLPDAPVYFTGCSGDPNCTVQPGDNMSVSITEVGADSWHVHMSDNGKWTYDITLAYASSKSSVEWIHELPTLVVVPIPVGNAGVVHFAGDNHAVVDGSTRTIAGTGAFALDAIPVMTTTSALNSAGTAFNLCTYAISCAAP